MQSVLPREDFDRLASDIASDRVEELCLSCRTDLWVRSPTLSPQIWYMAPGKIGKGMIDEIWWSKSYETDIREAKEVAAEPQTQPAKPQPAKSASRLAAFILIGDICLGCVCHLLRLAMAVSQAIACRLTPAKRPRVSRTCLTGSSALGSSQRWPCLGAVTGIEKFRRL